jgi:nitroimidazol reductase NimA-like FMN-containing flavoprotein (pyridoxamine 5'-phosphate oxidase superfamily)
MADRVFEGLSEHECLELIAPGGIGRIAYVGRFGPAVLPVNYEWRDGAIVIRTAEHGPLDEDLRTGIADADYHVAFEIDEIDQRARSGWSVLAQGPAHHVTEDELGQAATAVEPWAPGDREMVIRIVPSRLTGRRVGTA